MMCKKIVCHVILLIITLKIKPYVNFYNFTLKYFFLLKQKHKTLMIINRQNEINGLPM